MPTVSFYLSKELLEEVKKEAKEKRSSVSKVIQEALKAYFRRKSSKKAKEKLLSLLKGMPFPAQVQEELEKEREEADENRG